MRPSPADPDMGSSSPRWTVLAVVNLPPSVTTTMTAGSRSMSHSYLDVQDLNSEAEEMLRSRGGQDMEDGRQLRHQSLTYGVSEAGRNILQ